MRPLYQYADPTPAVESRRPTVTVGGEDAMFRGYDHFALQGAIDYVSRLGGGTVQLQPGRFVLRNAVFLPGNTTLRGQGASTVLQKAPSRKLEVTADSDWYSWKVKVAQGHGLAVGDGITLQSQREEAPASTQVSRHTVVAVEGGTLWLDSMPRMNHWMGLQPLLINTHSLLEAQRARAVKIENLALDGNRAHNENLNGNYGGAIFLHDCEDVAVRNVNIADFNGDGISWQIVHDVCVEHCDIGGCAGLGLHPGSGSQRPRMVNNHLHDCEIGLFWCWGVRHGLAEGNTVERCRLHGISIGHRDTDNLIRGNQVAECGEAGIFFRVERSPAHTAHRVRVEGNTVRSSSAAAAGIELSRGVEDAIIRDNRIIVPAGCAARAIVVHPDAVRAQIEANCIEEA